jgi:formate dehydrogenase
MVFIRSLSRPLRRPATSFLSTKGTFSSPGSSPFRAAPLGGSISGARTLTASANLQGKVLMVLYDVSTRNNIFLLRI